MSLARTTSTVRAGLCAAPAPLLLRVFGGTCAGGDAIGSEDPLGGLRFASRLLLLLTVPPPALPPPPLLPTAPEDLWTKILDPATLPKSPSAPTAAGGDAAARSGVDLGRLNTLQEGAELPSEDEEDEDYS